MPREVTVILIILGVILAMLLILFLITLKAHNNMFGKRFVPNPLVKYYQKEEFNLDYESVEFKCGKDMLKGGLYSKGKYKDDVIVIFCHGMWSSIDAYTQDIAYICNNGYQVLGFNYTGTDTSEGKSIRGLGQSLKCADSAVNYIKTRFPNKKIYVVGHSWGGYAASNIIHYHKDIKKVVALAPFVSLKNLLSIMMKKSIILVPFMLLIEYIKIGNYARKSALKGFKTFSGLGLIIHSKNDNLVDFNNNTGKLIECGYKNTSFIINDNKLHNPHYSDNAIALMIEYNKKVHELSKEGSLEYKKNFNYHAMGELDTNVMDQIVKFLNE